ncbi:amidohydrolase family protein [uncultured Roseibium sp.]|uniref:amidohydrolase family protein n=1 Tax=uncultured Roseibium sp. TaxID=1936171 RepID=UPI0026159B5D|nr:amidohydrolase family protein [uncultured Roseibium sp.]
MTLPVLFRDVRLLDLCADDGMTAPTDLLTRDGQITAIGPRLLTHGARVIEGHGHLLMPGIVNAHFHSSVNHMKGRLPCLPLELFMLYESPALDVLAPTPREAYLRTMLGCLEMLSTGTTTVGDDCFFVPRPTPEIIDAVCQAYADSGIRATVALDEPELSELEKLPFLGDIAPPEIRARLAQRPSMDGNALLEMYAHLIGTWHGAAEGRIAAAVSCSAPQRVSPEYFAALDDLSSRHGLPFFAHMLETRLQRVLGTEKFGGRSLVRYTNDIGHLSERMLIIHAIWVDAEDLDLIAASGASVAHNPNSNLRLGSGIMPFRALRDRGIPICLGVDEAIADDAVNMWSVMKTAGMLHTLSGDDPDRWPCAREILTAATSTGGAALRREGLGSLTVGAPADLVMVDLSTLAFLPLNDLARQLVHVELGQSVRLTMVAGRVVFEDGRITTVDQGALMEEARALFSGKQAALSRAAEEMASLLPFYRAMYDKAVAMEVGMARKLAGELI